MKRKDKQKEQSLKNVGGNATEKKQKDEFKIELIKVGKLVQNTEQGQYEDFTPPPLPE